MTNIRVCMYYFGHKTNKEQTDEMIHKSKHKLTARKMFKYSTVLVLQYFQ